MKRLLIILLTLTVILTACNLPVYNNTNSEISEETANTQTLGETPEPTADPETQPNPDPQPTKTSAPPPDEPPSFDKWSLWTNGTQLRGANTWQRVVVPRYDGGEFLGSDLVGPPYTQEDFNRLAALGANYVNLSTAGLFTERPPYQLDPMVEANLDNMISMAANADLFVVITFRTGPGRNDFTFYRDDDWFAPNDLIESIWKDAEAQSAWAEMWRYTAARYRDNPVVVGYDLMCEPNAAEIVDEWDKQAFYDRYAGTTYDWNAWYPDLVTAIREVDPYTPILVGGEGYSAIDWLAHLEPVDADRIVYTFHQYMPHQYTHQSPGDGFTHPGYMDIDYDGEEEELNWQWFYNTIARLAQEFGEEHNAVIAVNEYGVVRWAEGAPGFMRDQMNAFEDMGINYALWVWDPVWQPWNAGVNAMTFRYGPDPDNNTDVSNELQSVIMEYWSRNTVRPSTVGIIQ